MTFSFEAFKHSLAGDVLQPGEAGYDEGIKRWSPAASRPAKYVVCPKTTDDIAKAIRFARENEIDLAVCGGGHSFSVSQILALFRLENAGGSLDFDPSL